MLNLKFKSRVNQQLMISNGTSYFLLSLKKKLNDLCFLFCKKREEVLNLH
jgi:hypothetical protein